MRTPRYAQQQAVESTAGFPVNAEEAPKRLMVFPWHLLFNILPVLKSAVSTAHNIFAIQKLVSTTRAIANKQLGAASNVTLVEGSHNKLSIC